MEIYENHINIKYQSTQFLNPGSYFSHTFPFHFWQLSHFKERSSLFCFDRKWNRAQFKIYLRTEQNRNRRPILRRIPITEKGENLKYFLFQKFEIFFVSEIEKQDACRCRPIAHWRRRRGRGDWATGEQMLYMWTRV